MSFKAIHLLPGSPLGRLPEARGRGDAVVSGAVYLPPPPRRTNGRPAVPPPHCHSKSLAPQPAEEPPRLLAGEGRNGQRGRRQWPGGGAWGFLETPGGPNSTQKDPSQLPLSASVADSAGNWGPQLRGAVGLECAHSRTWKGLCFSWACWDASSNQRPPPHPRPAARHQIVPHTCHVCVQVKDGGLGGACPNPSKWLFVESGICNVERKVKVLVAQLCGTLCDPLACPWNSPGKNNSSLLQGNF